MKKNTKLEKSMKKTQNWKSKRRTMGKSKQRPSYHIKYDNQPATMYMTIWQHKNFKEDWSVICVADNMQYYIIHWINLCIASQLFRAEHFTTIFCMHHMYHKSICK